jgi:hypothetical protein
MAKNTVSDRQTKYERGDGRLESISTTGGLLAANNLSDVDSASTSLANLGGLPLAGGTMSGAIAMGSNKITGLANGSAASDVAAFGQIPVADSTGGDILPVGTSATAGSNGKWADSGHVHPYGQYDAPGRIPADGGLITWSYDPALAVNTTNVSGGVMYLAKIVIRQPCTITNLWFYLSTAIGGATAGENFILLYNTAGSSLLGNTASTAIDTAIGTAGFISHAMASSYSAAAGSYWIGVLFGSASSGALARATGNSILGPNFGQNASSSAWFAADGTTGLASTTPPSSVASFSNTNALTICVGCS